MNVFVFNDINVYRNDYKKTKLYQHRNSWSAGSVSGGQSTYRSQATEMSDVDRDIEELRTDLPGSLLTPPPGMNYNFPPCPNEIIYLLVDNKKFETSWQALLRFPLTKLGL